MTRVLIVEDDLKIRASLVSLLRSEGFVVEACASAEEAEARSGTVDLLLLDVRLPGESGVAFARRLAEAGRLPPTIVLSGEASIGETVEALKLGVHDFLEKPVRRERLLRSIENALTHAALSARVAALESRIDGAPEILGTSPAIERLRGAIRKVAATDAKTLILGESGAGKELVAAAIHTASARRGRPLVKVNCAALPGHLIEDELFGHARGAFTDAKTSRAGLFEEAHGGTLFLDEIGDLDLGLQGRLLRVLEDGRVRRMGETRDRAFDVRVIAATHRPLEQEVEAGRFRQDLYFRLAHLPLEVPALRDRPEDIPLLFDHFVARFAERYHLRRREIDPEIYPPLCAYSWPGNVRELSNLAERLVVLGSDPLGPDQLPAVLSAGLSVGSVAPTGLLRPQEVWPPLPWREWKAATEREYLESVLRRAEWSFTAAASCSTCNGPTCMRKPPRSGWNGRSGVGGKGRAGTILRRPLFVTHHPAERSSYRYLLPRRPKTCAGFAPLCSPSGRRRVEPQLAPEKTEIGRKPILNPREMLLVALGFFDQIE